MTLGKKALVSWQLVLKGAWLRQGHHWSAYNACPTGCGSKIGTQNGILVNGNKDKHLRSPSPLILSHTQLNEPMTKPPGPPASSLAQVPKAKDRHCCGLSRRSFRGSCGFEGWPQADHSPWKAEEGLLKGLSELREGFLRGCLGALKA